MGETNRERSHHSRLDDGCEYAYTVEFDSAELIQKSIAHINEKLFVSELQYTTTIGRQKSQMNEHEISRGDSFVRESSGAAGAIFSGILRAL